MWATKAAANVKHFKAISAKKKVNVDADYFIIDANAGKSFTHMMHQCSPCITRSRGANGGHYVTKLRRFMTIWEIGQLQGFPTRVTAALRSRAPSDTVLGGAYGDAMSVNVLMRILPRALFAAGLLPKPARDAWENAKALLGSRRDVRNTTPDALCSAVGALNKLLRGAGFNSRTLIS